jgi:hypothetical protein
VASIYQSAVPAHCQDQSDSRPPQSGKAHHALKCRPQEKTTRTPVPTLIPSFPILTSVPRCPIVASQHTRRSSSNVREAASVWRSAIPRGFTSPISEWLGVTPSKPPRFIRQWDLSLLSSARRDPSFERSRADGVRYDIEGQAMVNVASASFLVRLNHHKNTPN